MTDVDKVRVLIGDTAKVLFPTDDQIQMFLDLQSPITGTELLYMSAANACDALAAKFSQGATSIKLGNFSQQFKGSDTSFAAQAKAYRDLVYNTPAFAIAEENLSSMNALQIIRNFIMRTMP